MHLAGRNIRLPGKLRLNNHTAFAQTPHVGCGRVVLCEMRLAGRHIRLPGK